MLITRSTRVECVINLTTAWRTDGSHWSESTGIRGIERRTLASQSSSLTTGLLGPTVCYYVDYIIVYYITTLLYYIIHNLYTCTIYQNIFELFSEKALYKLCMLYNYNQKDLKVMYFIHTLDMDNVVKYLNLLQTSCSISRKYFFNMSELEICGNIGEMFPRTKKRNST